jgi:hypothetical protein
MEKRLLWLTMVSMATIAADATENNRTNNLSTFAVNNNNPIMVHKQITK